MSFLRLRVHSISRTLTVQNGDTRTTSFKEGGAMYLHNNVTTTISGSRIVNNFSGANGAIENRGTLTINNSVISGNQTIPASGSVAGGGIRNAGTLTINNSTISNNSVRGEGGGIFITVASGVTVNINNSTISGNTASVTGGGLGNGGGIATTGNQGTINITNSTISGNRADNNGGGAYFVTPAWSDGQRHLDQRHHQPTTPPTTTTTAPGQAVALRRTRRRSPCATRLWPATSIPPLPAAMTSAAPWSPPVRTT